MCLGLSQALSLLLEFWLSWFSLILLMFFLLFIEKWIFGGHYLPFWKYISSCQYIFEFLLLFSWGLWFSFSIDSLSVIDISVLLASWYSLGSNLFKIFYPLYKVSIMSSQTLASIEEWSHLGLLFVCRKSLN